MLKLERGLHETLPIGKEGGQPFYIQKQIDKGRKPPPVNEKSTMTCQLVLQWNAPELPSFDELVAIEETLIRAIGSHGDVDGHDLGASECNIFIETDDPAACFDALKLALDGSFGLGMVSAGYRRLDQEQFTPVWPQGLAAFTVA